ncbi:MAG: EamA family transporter RarD [Rhodoferax sp.]|nr:EamA family transporter RarD [Actinomycetota bacterium]
MSDRDVPADLAGDREVRRGTVFGALAYLLWGVFPLYFHALLPAGSIEILVHRVVWSLLVCLIVVAVLRDTSWIRPLLAAPRRIVRLGFAAMFIAVNWGVYIYGVNSGQVVEASLGYFINPLVTVLLGVVLLRERLRRLQWVAVGLGAVAVVVLTVDYGHVPVIALLLAGSFATYGLMKKRIGVDLGALAGLTAETALLLPFAVAALVWLEVTGRGTMGDQPPWHGLLLASTGIATAVPLLMFAAAARRVPLTTIGLLQFTTPVLQLLCGVLLLGEHVPPSRWVGFSIVWLALGVLTLDQVRAARARSRAVPETELTLTH